MKITIKVSASDINKMYIKQKYAKKKTLSDETRTLIKAMHELGYSYSKVAKMFDVTIMTAFLIVNQDKYNIFKCKVKERKRERYNNDPEYRAREKKKQKSIYKKKQRFYAENKLTKIKGE